MNMEFFLTSACFLSMYHDGPGVLFVVLNSSFTTKILIGSVSFITVREQKRHWE